MEKSEKIFWIAILVLAVFMIWLAAKTANKEPLPIPTPITTEEQEEMNTYIEQVPFYPCPGDEKCA